MPLFSQLCRVLIQLLILILPYALYAQDQFTISVLDSLSGQPVADAVVRIKPVAEKNGYKGFILFTDQLGIVKLPKGTSILEISYLGYQSVRDTIQDFRSRVYKLIRISASMNDVVVTGQYAPVNRYESVYQIEGFTQQDIRNKGATNLRELLQGSLDIDISHDAVFGSGVSLQGISGEGVKILVDGVPLVGRNNGILDISQIDLANIERTEIVKGPMSVLYGSDASGGVVNLITKTNRPELFDVFLKGYYESVGQYNLSIGGAVNLGKSHLICSGGRNFFGGYSVFDTMRHKDWAPKEQYFGNLKYQYVSGQYRFGISISFLRELLIDRGNLEPNTDYAFDIHYLTLRPMASVFGTLPLGATSKLDITTAYSGYVQFIDYYQKNLVTLAEQLQQGQTEDSSVYHDFLARAVFSYEPTKRKIKLQVGLDADEQLTHQYITGNRQLSMGDYALFCLLSWKPVSGLIIQPGLRLTYNTKFNFSLIPITYQGKSLFGEPLIPSLNLRYQIGPYFALRASYGFGYRCPSLQEQYLTLHDSDHNLNGNPDLKPEKSNALSLGIDIRIQKNRHLLTLTNTAFYNQINDKIDFLLTDASSTPVSYQYFNINNYSNAGAEQVLEYSWKRLNASAGVHCIYYRVQLGQPGSVPQTLFSPDFHFKAGYKIPKAEIGLMLAYKYTGKKLLYSITGGNANEQGFTYSFHTLDVSLTRDFWKSRIELSCGAKNILNVTNIATSGAVPFGHEGSQNSAEINWGRTYFVSLNLRFAK